MEEEEEKERIPIAGGGWNGKEPKGAMEEEEEKDTGEGPRRQKLTESWLRQTASNAAAKESGEAEAGEGRLKNNWKATRVAREALREVAVGGTVLAPMRDIAAKDTAREALRDMAVGGVDATAPMHDVAAGDAPPEPPAHTSESAAATDSAASAAVSSALAEEEAPATWNPFARMGKALHAVALSLTGVSPPAEPAPARKPEAASSAVAGTAPDVAVEGKSDLSFAEFVAAERNVLNVKRAERKKLTAAAKAAAEADAAAAAMVVAAVTARAGPSDAAAAKVDAAAAAMVDAAAIIAAARTDAAAIVTAARAAAAADAAAAKAADAADAAALVAAIPAVIHAGGTAEYGPDAARTFALVNHVLMAHLRDSAAGGKRLEHRYQSETAGFQCSLLDKVTGEQFDGSGVSHRAAKAAALTRLWESWERSHQQGDAPGTTPSLSLLSEAEAHMAMMDKAQEKRTLSLDKAQEKGTPSLKATWIDQEPAKNDKKMEKKKLTAKAQKSAEKKVAAKEAAKAEKRELKLGAEKKAADKKAANKELGTKKAKAKAGEDAPVPLALAQVPLVLHAHLRDAGAAGARLQSAFVHSVAVKGVAKGLKGDSWACTTVDSATGEEFRGSGGSKKKAKASAYEMLWQSWMRANVQGDAPETTPSMETLHKAGAMARVLARPKEEGAASAGAEA